MPLERAKWVRIVSPKTFEVEAYGTLSGRLEGLYIGPYPLTYGQGFIIYAYVRNTGDIPAYFEIEARALGVTRKGGKWLDPGKADWIYAVFDSGVWRGYRSGTRPSIDITIRYGYLRERKLLATKTVTCDVAWADLHFGASHRKAPICTHVDWVARIVHKGGGNPTYGLKVVVKDPTGKVVASTRDIEARREWSARVHMSVRGKYVGTAEAYVYRGILKVV